VANQLVGTVVAYQLVGTVVVACVINHHAPDHAISSGGMKMLAFKYVDRSM
jgi:hypothetical protein